MNKSAAVKHEQTTQHTDNIPAPSWGTAGDEGNGWDPSPGWNDLAWSTPMPVYSESDESRFFLRHLPGFIPFWIRGIEAAEKGETLRVEEYLEQVDRIAQKEWKTWRNAMDGKRAESSNTAAAVESQHNGWGSKSINVDADWDIKPDIQGWGDAAAVDYSWGSGGAWDNVIQDEQQVNDAPSASELFPGHILVDRVADQRSASPEKAQQLHNFFKVCMETILLLTFKSIHSSIHEYPLFRRCPQMRKCERLISSSNICGTFLLDKILHLVSDVRFLHEIHHDVLYHLSASNFTNFMIIVAI